MTESKRIQVVHVTFGLDVGGLEKLLVEFARHHDRDRYQLSVVSLGHIGPIGEQLRGLDIPVVCMHRAEGFRPSLIGQLRRCFRRIRADVVHSHDPRPLIYAAPAAKLAGVGSIVHTQHGRAFGESGRQKWLVRQSAKMVDHFVGVSQNIAEMALDLGVVATKVSVIRNGIGSQLYNNGDAVTPHAQRPYVLCVARLSPEKGVSTLIDAAALLKRKNPQIKTMIAGDGVCRGDLEKQIEELQLGDHVKLVGQTDRVDKLLSRARVFVLPSNSEGVALTLLEAMFARVPIVATDVGGTPEVITDQRNGLLVLPRQPAAMADAILSLWDDAETSAQFSNDGFELASREFGIDGMLRQYDRLYQRDRSLKGVVIEATEGTAGQLSMNGSVEIAAKTARTART